MIKVSTTAHLKNKTSDKTSKMSRISTTAHLRGKNQNGILGGLGYLVGSLAAGVAGVGEGVIDAVLALGADLTGNHDFAEYVFKNNVVGDWHEDITEEYNPTGVMQFFGDVASGIGQSAYFLIPYAGAPLFFTGVMSQGISGAAEQTGDVGVKEAAYGLTTGAIEGGLEMAFGAASKAGKTLLSGITKGTIKSTAKSAVRKGVVGQMLSGAASEFLEESASEVIDTYLQRLYKIDPNKELSIKDVLYSGLVGAVSGGVTAGVTSGLNAATNRARGENIIKNGNAQTVVNTATYVADKLAASGTDFKNASEWVRTLRGEVDAYNKLVEQGKGESASAHTILGEMQASLFFAETQAINAGITERIKNASEQDRAAMAEYINLNFDKKQRQKDFTADDIAANTNDITKQLAIMQMAGSPFFNYDAAMADQAQESAVENVIAKEQAKAAQNAESGVQNAEAQARATTAPMAEAQAAPVDAAFERAAARGQNVIDNGESVIANDASVIGNEDQVKYSLSKTKTDRLSGVIADLGRKRITKQAGDKKITIQTDDYTVNKNIYSDKGRKKSEVNARIKNIDNFEQLLNQSEYVGSDTNIHGLDKDTKKGVVAIHKFKTSIDGYDIEFLVRDKGKNQYLYEAKFIENKKSSQQSIANDVASTAPNGDVENSKSIPQKNGTVNSKSKNNITKHDLAEDAAKTAQESGEVSKGAETREAAKTGTETKESGESAEKSSESKNKSSETTPSTAEAVPLPQKGGKAEEKASEEKESLTDAQRKEKARKRAEQWIEWEKKTAPTAQELNTAREYVKGFDNVNNRRRLAILRTIRSAEGVDAQTVKGIANLMAVIPGSDLEVRFSDDIGPKGLITKVGNKTVIVIDSSTNRKNTIKGTIAHELTHYLENKAGYEQFSKFVREHAKPETIEKHKNKYIKFWNETGHDYTQAELDSEITASLVADALNNERFLKRYADRDKTILQRAGSWLKTLVKRSKTEGNEEISEVADEMAHKLIVLLQSDKTTGESKSGVKYSVAGTENEEITSIKEQLKKSNDKLASMTPIKSKELPRTFKNAKESLEWAVEVLKSSGELIQRKGYGEVVLDEKRLKNGLSYLKTDMEKVAFSLVPKVIKNGIEIGRHPKHKDRAYDTVTFASPVTVGDITGYMAVVIREEGKNYFKLHRVFMPDGSLFEFQETKRSNAETAGLRDANLSPTNVTSTNSIPQKSDLSTPFEKKYDLADDVAEEKADEKAEKKPDDTLNENGEVKDEYFAAAVQRSMEAQLKATQNTVDAYKEGNKTLNEKLSAERKRYSNLLKEASDLNDRIYFLENQNEAYKEGNQNLNELLLDARNKYKVADKQLDDVRTSLRQMGYDFEAEKRKVARKDKQIANQKNTIRELRREMWKIAKENAYLKSNKQFTIEDCKSIITAQVVGKYILKEKIPPEISIKKKDLNEIARALSIDLNNAFSDKGKGAEKAAQNAAAKLVDAVYINNSEYNPDKKGSKKTIPLTAARGEAYIDRLVEVVQADIFNEFVNIGRFVDAKKHNNDMLKIKALQKKIAEISKEYESEIYFLQNEAAKIEESLREENARLAELYAKSKAEWGKVYDKKEIKKELDNIFERGIVSQFFGGEYGANLPKKTRDGIAEYIALELNSSRSINDARVNEALKEAAREIVSRLTFTDIDNGEQYYLDKIVDEDSAKTFTDFIEADLINMFQNVGTLNPYAELRRRYELVRAEYLDKNKQAKERQEWGKELPKTYQAVLKIKRLAAQGKGSFSEAVQLVADELGKMVDESGHLHFGRIDAAMGEVARFFEAEAMKAASERDQLGDKAKVADDGVVWSVNPALQEKVEEYLRLRKGREGKALTAEELKLVGEVLRGMKTTIERYNKEFINGHWVDVETIASETVADLLDFVVKDKEYKTKIGKILGGKLGKTIDQGYFYYILSPETVIEALEGYKQGGLLKSLYHSVRVAKQRAEHRAVQMKKHFTEFIDDKENRWEAKKDQGGREGKSYSYRDKLNVRKISVNGTEITLGEAIYLLMLTKREHAWAGLQKEGFITYDENNMQRARIKLEDIPRARDLIANQLDKTDLEFLRMAEEFFNKTATKVKEDADMEIFGFTNNQDSYYVPIIRDRYSRMGGVTDARQSIRSIITVYNKTFTRNLVENAKALEGKNVMSIINDHADGLADYAELYLPLKAFDRVYNRVVETGEGERRSIREILNTKVWNGTEDYFKNLFSDIQGQRKDKPETFDKIVGKLRSAWVNSVLGANLKVVATQTTSLGAATQVIEPKYIMPAISVIPQFKGDKITALRERAYKYSDIIEARSFDMGALRAQGNIEKVSKIGEKSGFLIGAMDEQICLTIFHAAELKVQDTKGYAIGTEENARLAAKIADEAIYTTQAMTAASERSAMQRSKSEIMKLFAMFTSDSVKNLSHLYGNVMKYAAHSQRVKAGDASYKAALETDKKEIKRSMRTLATTGIMLGLITQGFKYLFAKEEEEPEDKVKDFAIDVASSTLNILPIASDIIDKFVFNYDISMNVLDVMNDSIETVAKGFKTAGKSMSGEYVSTSEAVSVTYDVIKSAAEMFGIPVSPVERTITGLMRRFTPSAIYGWDAMFSNPSYTADLRDAVENGDEALAEHILSQLYKSEVNGTYTSTELEEVARLYKAGIENVIPQKIGKEINGVTLNAAQRKQFTKTYSQASGEVNKLISSSYYSTLDDEQRAKAIKNVYAMYYGRAANEIVGKEMTTAVAYSYLTDNYAALFASQAYKSGLEEQVDLYGKKKTVKEQFVDYAANLGLSDGDLLVISYANGVRDKETKAAFLQYLNAMQLSEDVKRQIAERLGFEVKDGAVVEKSE